MAIVNNTILNNKDYIYKSIHVNLMYVSIPTYTCKNRKECTKGMIRRNYSKIMIVINRLSFYILEKNSGMIYHS